MAKLDPRPFPPGRYPVVVIGTGPGGLQAAYSLRRLGIKHALLSGDDGPAGMFRKFPIFQRLISWTKPHSLAKPGTREYERYDWNSLIGDRPSLQALTVPVMDGSSYFPTREEMEQSLTTFARKARVRARYGCNWESTEVGPDGFALSTSDGRYDAQVLIFAVGMTQPWKPPIPGIEAIPHYSDTRRPSDYQNKRVFLIGKRNSAFELADGLLPYAKQLILASPRPPAISISSYHVATARARYLQVYEDHVLAGGSLVIDASIQRLERRGRGWRVHTQGTTRPGDFVFDVDEVIAATGFTTPMRDLPDIGVATFSQGRLPAQTPYWESSSVPGIYFAGSVTQGAIGLKKYGIPSTSGAVQGMRYNARVLAEHLGTKHFGVAKNRPRIAPEDLVPFLLGHATEAPELWIQRSYLARAVSVDAAEGIRDEGIVPLAHFVDQSGPDAVAITVETGPDGAIRPAVYVRRKTMVQETVLSPDLRHDFRSPQHALELQSALQSLLGG